MRNLCRTLVTKIKIRNNNLLHYKNSYYNILLW